MRWLGQPLRRSAWRRPPKTPDCRFKRQGGVFDLFTALSIDCAAKSLCGAFGVVLGVSLRCSAPSQILGCAGVWVFVLAQAPPKGYSKRATARAQHPLGFDGR